MPTDPRVLPLASCFRLNGRLFENCFRGADDEAALRRPGTTDNSTANHSAAGNNMAFLGAHLVDARRYLANLLGPEVDNPFPELAEGESIDDFDELPSVERILAAWRDMGATVLDRLEAVPADHLDRESEQQFPVDDPTLLGGVAFLVQHESYHVGQLAYLRRLVGLGAMTYD